MMTAAILIIALIAGGLWRRWWGSGGPRSTKTAVGWVFMTGLGVYFGARPQDAGIVAALILVYWALGHGSYMDLGRSKPTDNELARYIVQPIARLLGLPVDSESYDYLGMSLRYGLLSAAIGVLMWRLGVGVWWVFAPVGFSAGAIYAAGWRAHGRLDIEGTEWGEIALGAITTFAYAVALAAWAG